MPSTSPWRTYIIYIFILSGSKWSSTQCGFCDAQIFKNHPLFSQDPTALQLMLYYDEVEVTNPLGSKTGKHKLGN